MGQSNPDLNDALKRLSSVKYGRPRAAVEKEIWQRLGDSGTGQKPTSGGVRSASDQKGQPGGSSFLDEWLAKRGQVQASSGQAPRASATTLPHSRAPSPSPAPVPIEPSTLGGSQGVSSLGRQSGPVGAKPSSPGKTVADRPRMTDGTGGDASSNSSEDEVTDTNLRIRGDHANQSSEVSIKLHD